MDRHLYWMDPVVVIEIGPVGVVHCCPDVKPIVVLELAAWRIESGKGFCQSLDWFYRVWPYLVLFWLGAGEAV